MQFFKSNLNNCKKKKEKSPNKINQSDLISTLPNFEIFKTPFIILIFHFVSISMDNMTNNKTHI